MSAAPALGDTLAQSQKLPFALTQANPQTCAVRLIDRRTGRPHRVNGRAVVLFSSRPETAAAELLMGRDASVWEVRIEQIVA